MVEGKKIESINHLEEKIIEAKHMGKDFQHGVERENKLIIQKRVELSLEWKRIIG